MIGTKKLHLAGTSNMRRHLQKKHGKRIQNQSDTNLIATMLQQSKPTWSQRTSDDLLIRLIIHENLSFRIVESQYFQQYLQYQRNTNSVPSSANTVKEWIIKNHKKAQTKVKSLLSSALSLIHLSIDGWTTPHQTMGILGIVAHLLDSMQNYTILYLDLGS